ncbi:hypothetical protein [Beijerinckia indica]|uniref:hypothetical protein n=1 Tax=Beijerinckia indica TaxID=533 RepID=UPI0011D107B1|nr:hypothetical protein [Beijerinckia indica]
MKTHRFLEQPVRTYLSDASASVMALSPNPKRAASTGFNAINFIKAPLFRGMGGTVSDTEKHLYQRT